MARASNKEQILREGLEVVRSQGFYASGVRDITAAAGVPQGSFSNHFASKEAFGLEILDRYAIEVAAIIERTLRDRARPPLERLSAYFDDVTACLEAREWRDGCLVGNMSLEAAERSEPLRTRLAALFDTWRQPVAACLIEAADAGQVRLAMPAPELADYLLSSWQGAVLRMKVERSADPLHRFKQITFSTILAPPAPGPATTPLPSTTYGKSPA